MFAGVHSEETLDESSFCIEHTNQSINEINFVP